MINARKVSSFFAIIMRGGEEPNILLRDIPESGIHYKEFMSEIIGVTTQHFTPHKLQSQENESKIFRI